MFAALAFQALLILVPAPRDKEGADKGPGWLGITYETDDDGKGFIITEIHDKSPAKKAGLLVGDRLLKFDGKQFNSTDAFVRQIVRTRPGTLIDAEIMRGEEKKTIKIKIAARPEDFPFPLPPPEDPAQDEPKKDEPKQD